MSSPVIILDDITHGPDGCQVFIIAFGVDIVEGLWRAGIPIRACEVNGNLARVREKIWGAAQWQNENDSYVHSVNQAYTSLKETFYL